MATQEEAIAIYQQAQRNLKTNPDSATDKFIVDMWSASKALFNENVTLKQELKDSQKRAADYSRKVDVLESKVAKLQGIKIEMY